MVQIKGYKITNVNFENKIPNGKQLKLQNQVKYNVNYIDGKNVCIGAITFRIEDADLNPFSLSLEMIAEFTYEEGDLKEDIHVESFDQAFPFLRQVVNQITSLSGMAGLMIPIMHLNRDTVSVGEPKEETSPLN